MTTRRFLSYVTNPKRSIDIVIINTNLPAPLAYAKSGDSDANTREV